MKEDQTIFQATQPYLDQPSVLPSQAQGNAVQTDQLAQSGIKKLLKSKTGVMLVLLGALIFLLLILTVVKQLFFTRTVTPDADQTQPETTNSSLEKTGLAKDLDLLKQQLKTADPATINLPVPPVDSEINLEE